MNFFKSSFFSDFKLQDVLALSQEDQPSSSRDTENLADSGSDSLISSDAEDEGLLDAKLLPDSGSSSSDAEILKQAKEDEAGMWGLGGLMKSITLKSEGVLQAYRKDLEEFGTGLKKETQMIAEVAAYAVKELPTSLETGAHIAQESIESVGQAVEDFSSSVWRGTADLISQGKDTVLRMEEDEDPALLATASSSSSFSRYDNAPVSISGGKYSRFEAQVKAMQHDSGTYCDEPADSADYSAWISAFNLSDKKQDIAKLIAENTFLQELLLRFVPEIVSEEVFWTRYFYQLHKLQQTEEARADLVKRASAMDEEDLTWDTEEEADDGGIVQDEQVAKQRPNNFAPDRSSRTLFKDSKGPANAAPEDEDDLGWEVAEDVDETSSNDGKRSSNSEASWEVPDAPKEDIRKRFMAQEEEDLTWDVDDGNGDSK